MTGRLWRHGLCIMPQMIAGVGGPSEIRPLRHLDAATTRGATMQPRSSFAHEELDDGHGPDGGELEAADEVLPDPVVSDVESSPKYRRLFGDLPLHRAVLEVYCRMAALGGCLMGGNMADTVRMSDLQMRALADEARTFIMRDAYDEKRLHWWPLAGGSGGCVGGGGSVGAHLHLGW